MTSVGTLEMFGGALPRRRCGLFPGESTWMVGRQIIDDALAARVLAARAVRLICAAASLSVATTALAGPRSAHCVDCHVGQAQQFDSSVHHGVVRCQECHGGEDAYDARPAAWARAATTTAPSRPDATSQAFFDHGKSFRGKPKRVNVPVLCGTCHSDVERMNPFGLRTDQLSSYWVSGHGKRLKQNGDEHVAICIDCHGAHDILQSSNPNSRTFFKNVPQTCGNCHGDRSLMQQYDLPADIPEQYSKSIHGRNVLEKGDSGSPNCATCHGNHAAAPPGYLEVGHVCGKCHKQIEDYFLASIHGRIPVMARCIGCHAGSGQRWNHQIEEASPPVDRLVAAYSEIREEVGDDPKELEARFSRKADELSGKMRFDSVCLYCHTPGRTGPHSSFFVTSDQTARECGQELASALRQAQFECISTMTRVKRLGQGVLLVQDEAVRAEDAKTELMALSSFIHTLNRAEVQTRVAAMKKICDEVNTGLDRKESALTIRRAMVLPIWIFIAVFCVLMYRKYKSLKHAYVVEPAAGPSCALVQTAGAAATVSRRRLLDIILSTLGAISAVALLFPAVSYMLPVRKRGGTDERVSAGKQEGWAVWEGRKVSVQGKPAAVIRTDSGFKAFSAVCTHLGCIVHWNSTKREFECPCHAAVFDAEGKVVSGPPPRGLPIYGVSVVQDEVIVKNG